MDAPLDTPRLMQRPIFGGVFGRGRYAMASMPCVSHGLHVVSYMVVEPRGGTVLSVAEDKVEALSQARRVIQAANDVGAELHAAHPAQAKLWSDEEAPIMETPTRRISRRRRAIFERTQGKCHYCGTTLQLDGKWHVEHMLPRALGGADDSLNLVAACVACNLEKRDRTALEFVTRDRQGR